MADTNEDTVIRVSIGLHYLLRSHPAHLLHGLRAAKTAALHRAHICSI